MSILISTKALPSTPRYRRLIFKLGVFIIPGLVVCVGAILAFRQVTSLACPKIGAINNKGIFAEQARRIANIKNQSRENQEKALTDTILSYSAAVREVSKAHNVILFDQSALATNVPDYSEEVERKLFGKRIYE